MNEKLIDDDKVILELALYLNKELLNEEKITYQMYKMVEDLILKKIK